MTERTPRLYDPRTLGRLGLLFTPAFAAWFAKRNWEELGEFDKADSQGRWFWGGVALLVVNTAAYVLHWDTLFWIAQVAWLVQVVWWYFKPQAHQTAWAKVKLKGRYDRRSLVVPGLLASLVLAAAVFAMAGREYDKTMKELTEKGLIAP